MKQRLLTLVNKVFRHSDLYRNIQELKTLANWQHNESQCLQYLLNLIGKNQFLANTGMAMSPVVICHILNEIVINNKKSIIEFGAGNSTIFIATLLNLHNIDAEFICIESDINWIQTIKTWITTDESELKIKFVHAPIKEQCFNTEIANAFLWYDGEVIRKELINKKFDLVIVDGPQGTLCRYSRYPAIPFLKEHLSDNYSIFLDDVNRPDEEVIYKRWCTMLGKRHASSIKRYAYIPSVPGLISRP